MAQLLKRGTKSGRKSIVGVRTSFIWSVVVKCPMQGVGQTENFQARVSNYISHILKGKQTCGIVKDFMETGGHSVSDFRIMGIVQLEHPPRSKADLKKRLSSKVIGKLSYRQ